MLQGIEAGWLWATGGILLLMLEMVAPGFFLVFIGAAAIATGAFTLAFGFGFPAQLALFVLYALLAVAAGRRIYGNTAADQHARHLNDPAARLIGKPVLVVEAVDDHSGRVRLGDGEWSARGGPAQPGDRARVTSVDGNCLRIEVERDLSST